MNKRHLKLLILMLGVISISFSFSCATFTQAYHYVMQNDLTVDPGFSLHLAYPQKNWPPKKKLSAIEMEVYAKMGRPDYIRIWWDRNGKLMTQKELREKFKRSKNDYKTFKKSWIYIDNETEIVFPKTEGYKEVPFSDKMKILAEYGDPQDIKINVTSFEDMKCDRWTYWSNGKHFDFVGDKLVKTQDFEPMGGTFPRM